MCYVHTGVSQSYEYTLHNLKWIKIEKLNWVHISRQQRYTFWSQQFYFAYFPEIGVLGFSSRFKKLNPLSDNLFYKDV